MTRLFVTDWIYKIAVGMLLLVFSLQNSYAQPECRSVLGAHLKPLSGNLPVNWAGELTLSPGGMRDRFIFNGKAYLGLEYVSKSMNHQFYFEGAYKYWYNTANGPGLNGTGTGYSDFNKPEKKHFGFRELYYAAGLWLEMKAGIQSMKSVGSMLLDERVLGISAKKDFSSFSLKVQGGTVYDDIARMQDVCGTRHLYNLVRGGKVNFVGDRMLDSNFILAELNWTPGKKKNTTDAGSDEFAAFETTSDSEFSEFSSVTESPKADFLKVKNVGFRIYEEFGEVFPDYKYYAGTNVGLDILQSLVLDAEALVQVMDGNNAVIWKTGLQKEYFRNSGAFSSLRVGYFGIHRIDSHVQYFPSYSNLFKGEVMKLDMMHLPLLEVEAVHRFAGGLKQELKGAYIHQVKSSKTREVDFMYSMQPWKHLNLHVITAYMQSKLMEKDNFLLKLEAHFAF